MKRLLTLALTLTATMSPLVAAPDMSSARRGSTPYDRYMHSVNTVLRQLNGSKPTFQKVAALTRQGYSFKYTFDTPYVAPMPHVTEAKREGDCKAKSLWLAARMNDPSVKYVIGKARRTSKISHAWLMWNHNNRWWILDPTNNPNPIPADRVGPDEYLLTYSYDKNGSYRHRQSFSRRSVAGSRN